MKRSKLQNKLNKSRLNKKLKTMQKNTNGKKWTSSDNNNEKIIKLVCGDNELDKSMFDLKSIKQAISLKGFVLLFL